MTRDELYQAVLRELGIVALDEVSPAEYAQFVAGRYAGLHAQLVGLGLMPWLVDEDIPTKFQQPVIWLLAFVCMDGFGVPTERRMELASLGAFGASTPSLAERQLRALVSAEYVPQVQPSEYF
jgi:hypothetical protein